MTDKKKEKADWRVICIGLIALAALEAYALYLGYNGTLLKTVMVVIGLVIGVTIPNPIRK